MSDARTDARPGGVSSWLSFWARRRPEHPCVIFEDRPWGYAEFDRAVQHLAGVLAAAGVVQGDRVGCLMPNRTEYLMAFWAAFRLGAIFVPYNVRLVASELAVVIDDSDPTVVVTDASFAALRAGTEEIRSTRWLDVEEVPTAAVAPVEVPWLAGDDPAVIVYTSGTTGRSKGVVLTHGNLLHQSLAWTSGFGVGAADVQINLMSLCYTGGLLNPTLWTFQSGASVVLEPRFDPASALRRIERWGVTWITATPEIVRAILEHPDSAATDLSRLKRIQTGGAPVPSDLAEQASQRGIDLIQGYGITEASAGINVFLPPSDLLRKASSIGWPAPYDEVRISDDAGDDVPVGEVGELLLRGPLVMQGYWRNPTATAETLVDGWLHTGDLARTDDEGFVTLVGRKKEMIISGGLNVYPVEVEQVISTFPEIADVAVVGLPDDKWGERVSAFVILQSGSELTEADLIERCRSRLAGYRIPRTVVFVEHFPRTASGKIQKPKLQQAWAQTHA
ncbi:long-chain fatty acid--CoA ligase [Jatrophihabitans sp.]|uniref:class I adenylate-forming enzyme family protein n=1 Tax=Jatrophihabitans sp. TaxID=1932789 RepID=UPI0030C6AAA8|nr:putative O-succinylbenzoate--CoA ligase [Jatrophihabitans sp.]